jgi:hypothetical protein
MTAQPLGQSFANHSAVTSTDGMAALRVQSQYHLRPFTT